MVGPNGGPGVPNGGPNGGGGGTGGGGGNGGETVFAIENTIIPQTPTIDSIEGLNNNQINNAKIALLPYTTESNYQLLFAEVSTIQGLLSAIATHNERVSSGTGGSGPNGNGNGPTFGSEKIYTPFEPTDIVTANKTTVTSGLFSNGAATLTSHFSASLLGDTSASYVEIYNADPDSDSTAQVQFAVGYAHIHGSGSIGNSTKTTSGNRETAALYRQFRNILLAPGEEKFKFTSSPSSSGHEDFYFVVFNRAQMREKVDPGNWELHLSSSALGGALVGAPVKLIDDSGATTNPDVNVSGRVFDVVSGSIQSGTAVTFTSSSTHDTTYTNGIRTETGAPGLFYPDLGIILLNPDFISGSAVVNASKGANTFGNNARTFYNAVSKSRYTAARREEEITSRSYFTRARNDKYNFSSNPTYKTGSKLENGEHLRGQFAVPSFKGDPRAYITQVGLYDGELDLIAVAKLSQPILKSFSREAVVKVKLDY